MKALHRLWQVQRLTQIKTVFPPTTQVLWVSTRGLLLRMCTSRPLCPALLSPLNQSHYMAQRTWGNHDPPPPRLLCRFLRRHTNCIPACTAIMQLRPFPKLITKKKRRKRGGPKTHLVVHQTICTMLFWLRARFTLCVDTHTHIHTHLSTYLWSQGHKWIVKYTPTDKPLPIVTTSTKYLRCQITLIDHKNHTTQHLQTKYIQCRELLK